MAAAIAPDRLAKLVRAFRRKRELLAFIAPTLIGAALCAAVKGRRR